MTPERGGGFATAEARDHARFIDKKGLLFDFAVSMFRLPAYFAGRVSLIREVFQDATPRSPTARPLAKRALRAAPKFHLVRTLDATRLDTGPREDRTYTPPLYRVEVDGFWRRLSPTSMGRDSEGHPVQGRTWVGEHLRWRDLPARTPEHSRIHVKSSVAAAIERANKALEENETKEIKISF